MDAITFEFKFEGNDSDEHRIDFYDVNQALIGFQRSLALTTHLVLNGKIITQAPSLKGARIYALPSEESSWKMTAAISLALTGIYHLGTTPHDTPVGHIIFSMYDYVISESLGFHVDYDKSLGELYEEAKEKAPKLPQLDQTRADSLIEKCSSAVKEMHRPIFMNATATTGVLSSNFNGRNIPLNAPLTLDTYEYLHETHVEPGTVDIVGRISSYNANSYKGRIYVPTEGRPITFELVPSARSRATITLIMSSLRASALERRTNNGYIKCKVIRELSKSGQLKRYRIIGIDIST
jgi:hypothetical protein